jgi:hypothetical protein
MFDDLKSSGSHRDGREGHSDATASSRVRKARTGDQEVRSVVEREVPLGQHEDRVLAPAIHSWLDGELPEAAVRKGETARDVEFWRELNTQLEGARHMRTPTHVEAQIMAALPHHAPALITPWWRREFVITPAAAVGAAAALIALSIAATLILVP